MKLFNRLLMISLVGVLVMSCNSLLEDVEPTTAVSGEAALTSEGGVMAIRASMYSKMRASFGYTTQYFVGPSAFTDETNIRPGATRFQGLNDASGTDGATTHLGVWGASYNILLDANLLVNAIADGVMDDAARDRVIGEALAIRAFVMHNLVRTYGYEPGNFNAGPENGWNLAAILRTDATLSIEDADKRPRATVTEFYNQIAQDLTDAKAKLAGTTNNTFANEAFAHGLSARVNLYRGEWAAAAADAQTAINLANANGNGLQTSANGVANMFVGSDPESLFLLIVDPNTEPIAGSNVNNGLAAYTSNQWMSQQPTQFVVDLYEAGDHRLGWYAPCAEVQTDGAPVGTSCEAVNDNGWTLRKWTGANGNLSDNIPYMRVAEMYLIRAEALARASGPGAGVGALNQLRNARGLGNAPASVTSSLDAFIDEILDERVRELVQEGHRFWDLKRTGRFMYFPNQTDVKFRSDSHRILAPIGQGLIGANELLCENPGYPAFDPACYQP
jgi:hypothetical protein